jgi:hypothetical protein
VKLAGGFEAAQKILQIRIRHCDLISVE